MRKMAGYLLAGAIAAASCGNDGFKTTGRIFMEQQWNNPSFGEIYRIEVRTEDGIRGYAFIGKKSDLDRLNRDYVTGDCVALREGVAFSMSLDMVLLPEDIRHSKKCK
ncbi:MAG: seg [archaeon GW2011_AR5]|nr:MAG: seg [archaeon GW2011_AR5]